MQFPQTVDNNKNNERKDENNNTENEVACQGPSNEFQEVENTILREDPALWTLQLKENEPGRGLAFRGHNEVIGSSNNGNYLDMLELLTQFDPVLKQYFDTFANKGKDLLERYDIDITNCRGQVYDNASNMSSKYSGLQARLKERTSTHRWDLLKGNHATLKRLSDTRWSSLCHIAEDTEEKSDTRHEALCLLNKITKLEFAFMAVLWHHILKRFNAVSKFLQKVELDLHTASSMLLSLIDFVKNLRNDFTRFENESKKLSSFIEKDYSDKNKRKVIKKLSNGENQVDSLSVSDKFRVNTFFAIIDKLVTQLTIRSDGYNYVNKLFGFLSKLLTISTMELQVSAKKIVEVYSNDLEDSFIFEIEQFVTLLKLLPPGFFSHKKDKSETENTLIPLHVLNWIVETDIIDVFPNVYIAYRLFLTIPITNCEAERSFSTLKRVKNMHRSTMVHSRLSNIARLTIESKLLETLDFSDVIAEFAGKKSRKKSLNLIQ
ncbi:uncharacterized protein LOC136081363 [Hydra vulgaris]|uniref:Uncharacterized protein LOC136081363 n=1 Tax=Hydra vulgaris TaxID=6087 RepID=A0ABM4BZR8_HYDVU